MKELDFLPDWHRADRQRKLCRHRHFVVFGLVAALMTGWSFIVGHSVSGLQAQTRQIEATLETGQQILQAALEKELAIEQLRREAEILEALKSRTAVSAILGELSHSVNEQIIFSKVALVQEPVPDGRTQAMTASGGIVRIGASKSAAQAPVLPDGPQRMRMTLVGIAAGGADVARLIERLEASGYYKTVSPGFSRARKVGSKEITEFEISCIIADYTVQREH